MGNLHYGKEDVPLGCPWSKEQGGEYSVWNPPPCGHSSSPPPARTWPAHELVSPVSRELTQRNLQGGILPLPSRLCAEFQSPCMKVTCRIFLLPLYSLGNKVLVGSIYGTEAESVGTYVTAVSMTLHLCPKALPSAPSPRPLLLLC